LRGQIKGKVAPAAEAEGSAANAKKYYHVLGKSVTYVPGRTEIHIMGTQTLRRFLVAGGFTAVLLAAGCASMRPAETPKPDVAPAEGAAAAPVTPPSAQAPQPQPPPPVSAPTPATVPTPAPKAARVPPPASAAPIASPPKTKSQPPDAAGKPANAAAAEPQPAAAPAPATLDLTSLERRLRDTRAIGVFTKLSLKNQVDDLLGDFRAFYKAAHVRPSPELRQRYDLLLLKVLSLLQDGDPPLAAAISSSKEAIWSILADPDKLEKI
jgi:hypothetical protein